MSKSTTKRLFFKKNSEAIVNICILHAFIHSCTLEFDGCGASLSSTRVPYARHGCFVGRERERERVKTDSHNYSKIAVRKKGRKKKNASNSGVYFLVVKVLFMITGGREV